MWEREGWWEVWGKQGWCVVWGIVGWHGTWGFAGLFAKGSVLAEGRVPVVGDKSQSVIGWGGERSGASDWLNLKRFELQRRRVADECQI